ncbi:hypothetical protein ACWGF2_05330 [Streptomyces sp. NPDC054919]
MRRSTFITRALGSVALLCAAVPLSLVFVPYDAPAPRWDMVGPDRLPALLDRLLCVSAAATLVVLALRGLGEASRSLPEGLSWTVEEESDPSIA